ncbi:MAG: hypothetical protein KUG77_00170 [Nannocystaceae bacterium]|nr:hypothetical protein [Nannocystaceae bacterium]
MCIRDSLEGLRDVTSGAPLEVFIALPARAHAERIAYRETHAQAYGALANARALPQPDAKIAALEALRTSVIQNTAAQEVRTDPLFQETTAELYTAYIAGRDHPRASAELPLLNDSDLTRRILEAQWAATIKHRRANTLYNKSVKAGLAAEDALASTGGVDPDDLKVHVLTAKTTAWSQMLRDSERLYGKTLILKKKSRRGDAWRLHFEDRVVRTAKRKCADTGRVERIHADGKVEYQSKCRKTGGVRVDRTQHAPILVPAAEAALLTRGDRVTLVSKGENGHVVYARRTDDGPLVQIRAARLGR